MTVVPSKFALAPNELYQTPAWVTRALLRRVPLRDVSIWEPFAGEHKMADVLAEAGNVVITSDLVTYSRPHAFEIDFFGDEVPPIKTDALVSNPPYGHVNSKAAKAARLALQRCAGVVAMLCTAKFDAGNTRWDLFAENPRWSLKITLTDRVNWFEGGEHDNTESHAWYVWGPASGPHPGAPRIAYEGQQ